MFVLWRTRCNHDAALLIPTALPVHTMCIVRSRRVRPSRTDRFLADGRGSSVRHFAKSGICYHSRKRVSPAILRRRSVKRSSRCFCFAPGTHDSFYLHRFFFYLRAGVIIDWDCKATAVRNLLHCPLTRRARPIHAHVLGLFYVMRDEKVMSESKSRASREECTVCRIKNDRHVDTS